MTQEEKAKRYDEAIRRVREFVCKDNVEVAEYIFPELAESDNERVRKDIIWCLKHSGISPDRPINPHVNTIMKDAIAWIEKQEGCEYIKKDWLEHIKQSWYKEGFIDGKYSGGTSKEWTINDATTLSELIDFFENGTAKLQHDLSLYASWLKSLRPQNTWKPSEEQMKALHDLNLTGNISYAGQGQVLIDLYNSLKEL